MDWRPIRINHYNPPPPAIESIEKGDPHGGDDDDARWTRQATRYKKEFTNLTAVLALNCLAKKFTFSVLFSAAGTDRKTALMDAYLSIRRL